MSTTAGTLVLLAELQELIMGSTLVKCAAADVGIQWAGWALAAALKTEKFYDLAGNVETNWQTFPVNSVDLQPCAGRFSSLSRFLTGCNGEKWTDTFDILNRSKDSFIITGLVFDF